MRLNRAYILAVNAGSSSLKFSLFSCDSSLRQLVTGKIEGIHSLNSTMTIKDWDNPQKNFTRLLSSIDYLHAIQLLINWMEEEKIGPLIAIGHRIVHGGPTYHEPTKITADVLTEFVRYSAYDPEHLPNEMCLITEFQKKFPHLLQIACFDTAFHYNMPKVATILPIPRRFYLESGVRRYGFHGLSYAWLITELERKVGREKSQGKVILAHLGNGASLAAVYQGKSIDTSMSFTPTSGVPMSTRSGDLDPSLAWYFMHKENMTIEQFNEMINTQSGLLGVSESSSDIRDLLKNEAMDHRAFEAIELFCYQIRKWIGALAAALGGLDIVVFSGGIGENQAAIRKRICAKLDFLGMRLDDEYNANNQAIISEKTSKVAVHVISTNEEKIIAQMVYDEINIKKY